MCGLAAWDSMAVASISTSNQRELLLRRQDCFGPPHYVVAATRFDPNSCMFLEIESESGNWRFLNDGVRNGRLITLSPTHENLATGARKHIWKGRSPVSLARGVWHCLLHLRVASRTAICTACVPSSACVAVSVTVPAFSPA